MTNSQKRSYIRFLVGIYSRKITYGIAFSCAILFCNSLKIPTKSLTNSLSLPLQTMKFFKEAVDVLNYRTDATIESGKVESKLKRVKFVVSDNVIAKGKANLSNFIKKYNLTPQNDDYDSFFLQKKGFLNRLRRSTFVCGKK